MSNTRSRCNAQLALVRLAARRIDDQRARHEVEQARFAVFAALESEDDQAVRLWCRTLRVAAQSIPDWAGPEVIEAISEIELEVTGSA